MNPFLMEANQGLRMEYSRDMCPASKLEMSRQSYIYIRPEWTEAQMDSIIAQLRDVAKQL